MEYVQMTLDNWMRMKQKLKQELLGVRQSFVRIGYALRKIEDQKLYEQDGYKSIAEFAKAEYGLEPSTTSRFMSINREYSVDGYSETLRPEFDDLSRSQLEEMLKLPDSDRQMIQPEASREDIRNLKRFNKTEPETGVADDIYQLVENFYRDNPDILNEVFNEGFNEQNIKRFAEIVNPGGNRSYKKGLFFLMMYENRVAVKKFGDTPQDLTWWQFYRITMDIFGNAAAGPKTWRRYFGGEDDEGTENEPAGNGEIHGADNPGAGSDGDVPANDAKPSDADGGGEKDTSGSDVENGRDNVQPASADNEGNPEVQSNQTAELAGRKKRTEDNVPYGEESCKGDCQKPAAGEAPEPAGAESQGEEIAPAQKFAKILEKEAANEAKNKENHGAAKGEKSEPTAREEAKEAEPGIAAVNHPEIIEKPFGSRKDYLDTLSVNETASYIAKSMKTIGEDNRKPESIIFWGRWLSREVDANGKIID